MRGRRTLAFIVPGFVVTFGIAVAAGYLMGQTSFRPSVPPPSLTVPTASSPGVAARPSSAPRAPGIAEPSPDTTPQADQPGGVESPQNPSPGSAMPSEPPSGPQGDVSPPSAPPVVPPRGSGPTAVPAIPGPPIRFHVQVGSFADRDSATSLVQQLRDHGFAVTLVEGPPYRVWVGGFRDRTTAERLAANLKSAGYDATWTPR